VLTFEAVIFAVFMIFVGSRIIRPLRRRVERLSTHNAPLILSLAICLLLSWLAVKIGMAAIIGAFFAGLAFADYAPEWDLLPSVTSISDFLAPYFFFSIGSQLDVGLFKGNVLIAAVVISILAIISKVLGCGLPLLREGVHTSLTVGIGMMPRGEVALIVALVGLNSRIVPEPTYAIVVFMTAVTTVLAPPMLRYMFREEVREAETAASQ
jgi:Kef-type K+ transport system membrane component KefB